MKGRKMKDMKFMSAVLAVIFLLLPLPPMSVNAETEKILLYESTFETNSYEGWTSLGNHSKLSIDHAHSHCGYSSLLTSKRTKAWSGPTLNITQYITAGETLYFSSHVFNDSEQSGSISISLKFTDTNGDESYLTVNSIDASPDVWLELAGKAEMPENITDASLYFETDSEEINFCIDDIQIYTFGTALVQKETVIPKNKIQKSFDFEDAIEEWRIRGDMSIEISDQFSYHGKCSLYAFNRTEIWNGPMVRLDNISPGVDYTYSAYVMYNGKEYEETHRFLIELQYNYEGEEVYSVIAGKELQKGTWSNISGDFTVPENATDIYFYVQTEYVESDNNITENDLMSFYVDQVTITDSTYNNQQNKIRLFLRIGLLILAAAIIFLAVVYITRKIRSVKRAVRAASMDAMTNTCNRNTYEEQVAALERDPQKCRDLYVTSCDVNFLKYINDNYGHESGDKAIIRCAQVLRRALGKKGQIYRIGGDEFMCFSHEDPTSHIRTVLSLEAARYDGYPFSAAFGTSHFTGSDHETPDIRQLIAESDREMYKNKQEIKNNFKEFSEKEDPAE